VCFRKEPNQVVLSAVQTGKSVRNVRGIEQDVHHVQQPECALVNIVDIFAVLFVLQLSRRLGQQKFGESDNCVQRGPALSVPFTDAAMTSRVCKQPTQKPCQTENAVNSRRLNNPPKRTRQKFCLKKRGIYIFAVLESAEPL
jgi:hypothetical protein